MKFFTYNQAINAYELMISASSIISNIQKFVKNIGYQVSKRTVSASIFVEALKLIIQDIIDNGDHFQLPVKNFNTEAILHIAPISGKDFQSSKRAGKFKDVDYYLTNFKAFRLFLTITKLYKSWNISVYLPQKYTKQIDDNANNGKTYF